MKKFTINERMLLFFSKSTQLGIGNPGCIGFNNFEIFIIGVQLEYMEKVGWFVPRLAYYREIKKNSQPLQSKKICNMI